MRVLALEIPVAAVDPEAFTPDRLSQEAAEVWRLYQAGIVREIYYRQDRKAKVITLECADLNEAQHVIAGLPLVKLGLIAFDVTGLVPYRGFSRLMK